MRLQPVALRRERDRTGSAVQQPLAGAAGQDMSAEAGVAGADDDQIGVRSAAAVSSARAGAGSGVASVRTIVGAAQRIDQPGERRLGALAQRALHHRVVVSAPAAGRRGTRRGRAPRPRRRVRDRSRGPRRLVRAVSLRCRRRWWPQLPPGCRGGLVLDGTVTGDGRPSAFSAEVACGPLRMEPGARAPASWLPRARGCSIARWREVRGLHARAMPAMSARRTPQRGPRRCPSATRASAALRAGARWAGPAGREARWRSAPVDRAAARRWKRDSPSFDARGAWGVGRDGVVKVAITSVTVARARPVASARGDQAERSGTTSTGSAAAWTSRR